jgi:hypothetical protein
LTQSRQALYSLLVNIELFCIFQTRKKKKRKSFLPPLCIDLPLVYKSQMRVYLLFPDMCQRHFCRRYIISCVCCRPDPSARVDFYIFLVQPNSLDAQALTCWWLSLLLLWGSFVTCCRSASIHIVAFPCPPKLSTTVASGQ